MRPGRHARGAGTLPRSLVALGAAAILAGTGTALWLLPTVPDAQWATPSRPSPPETLVAARQTITVLTQASPASPGAGVSASAMRPPAGSGAPPYGRTGGRRYVGFLDVTRDARGVAAPGHDAGGDRRERVRRYTIGHLIAGPDGCTPRWAGSTAQGRGTVAARLARIRAEGGEARLAFGGPSGPEPSATCRGEARLVAAYRRLIAAYDPEGIDFEVADSADSLATGRRAGAIVRLQAEARDRGRTLGVSFTLPATERGLSSADLAMLRATREAGASVDGIGLLVPVTPGSAANLSRLTAAARSAHDQLGVALGVAGPRVWGLMGLTPVLTTPRDLDTADARRLVAFSARNGLGWLSVRGATPPDEVVELLAEPGL
ncbi:hypothetical protein [Microbispora sp. NPDC049125]|uniref:hypothetical protein n=1 Tax=Microbispora sp. NPDC049125 TaxID=3154929 RepID=UPI003466BD0D